MNHLTGEQALVHARNRSVGRSDYRRTERQQDILNALHEKVKSTYFSEFLSVAEDIYALLTTNMAKDDLLSYGASVMMMDASQVENYRIPQEGAYEDAVIRKMQVLFF